MFSCQHSPQPCDIVHVELTQSVEVSDAEVTLKINNIAQTAIKFALYCENSLLYGRHSKKGC